MKKLLQIILSTLLLLNATLALADARVFQLTNPNPQEVVDALRQTYGDKIQADLVQQRLVVVGSKQQLDEVGALLVKLDPAPIALRLTVRDQPPADDTPGTITYSTGNNGYTIDTIEGALVALDYSKFAQRVSSVGAGIAHPGWWVNINDSPTLLQSLTLQVRVQGGRKAIVLVSYTKEENQERRVFGNTVTGDLGSWIPLLPEPEQPADGTISSGPKRGSQLYLQVQKNYQKTTRRVAN